jgi:hypothetical protein
MIRGITSLLRGPARPPTSFPHIQNTTDPVTAHSEEGRTSTQTDMAVLLLVFFPFHFRIKNT